MQKQEIPKTSLGDWIRNGANIISLQSSFGGLIIIRNGAKTICLPNYMYYTFINCNKTKCMIVGTRQKLVFRNEQQSLTKNYNIQHQNLVKSNLEKPKLIT
jgi:hypothetical protein